MALAVTEITQKIENDKKVTYCTIDDDSYATGGTVYTAKDFLLAVVEDIIFLDNVSDTVKMRHHDKTNKKLLAYNATDGAQVTAAADAGKQRVKVIGH